MEGNGRHLTRWYFPVEESLLTLALDFPRATGILSSLMRVCIWGGAVLGRWAVGERSQEADWVFWVVPEPQG